MLSHLPRHVPPVAVLLDDLGNPTAAEIARVLGVSVRTVWRWQAGEWPRCAQFALFFASRWGWSLIDSEARFRVSLAEQHVVALRAELDQARAQLAHVLALADTGAANAPVMRA